MKKLLIILIGLPSIIIAQKNIFEKQKTGKIGMVETTMTAKVNSASLKHFYNELIKYGKDDSLLINKYQINEIDKRKIISCLFILKDDDYIHSLEKKGMLVHSRSSGIHTGHINIDSISNFLNDTNFISLEMNRNIERLMSDARTSSYVDFVQGTPVTEKAYYGEGVIVGIIDIGFDYTHPNFFDETGSDNFRIKRVWDMRNSSGLAPDGFFYGSEFTSQFEMNAAETDDISSHGTHVAGIASGSGVGDSDLAGVAPKSELVFVSLSGIANIVDAIDYIFDYAESVNKPCVINMSLGNHIGPHDGTSLLDQYIDLITGNGKIIVGAAGNEGNSSLHLSRSFTSDDSQTFSLIESRDASTNHEFTIELWGSPFTTYAVSVNLYNNNTKEIESYTPYYFSNEGGLVEYTIEDDDFLIKDKCYVSFTSNTSIFNSCDNIKIGINNLEQDDNYRYAMLEIVSSSGTVHAWASNSGEANFTNGGNFSSIWQNGDSDFTVGEIGGTANEIISVGAYTTKNVYYDFLDNAHLSSSLVDDIADFSSKGPTVDGRLKPEITAPGNILVSSVNSFDGSFTSTNERTVAGITDGVKDWWFGALEGTSMASPMVTGIIALCLEADPTLTPSEIKSLLSIYSNEDSFTGFSLPNNTWGYGKIDAFRLLNQIELISVNQNEIEFSNKVFPNPTKDLINVLTESKGNFKLFDNQGKEVKSGKLLKGINVLSIDEYKSGLFYLKIQNTITTEIIKIVKN